MSKYKIYILIASVVGAVIIAAGYITTHVIREKLNQNLISDYASNELLIAKTIATTIEAEIRSVEYQLALMGEDPEIKDGKKEECIKQIKTDLEKTHSKLGNVGRVDKDGLFRCSMNPALIGTKASNLGAYITTIFEDPEHKPVMSKVIKVPGAESHLVALHVPVYSEAGFFDGTLGGAMYLSDLHEKYLKDVVFAERGFVVLVDDDGTIIHHNSVELIGKNTDSREFGEIVGDKPAYQEMIEEIKKGNSGIKRYHNNTEGEKIAGFAPVKVLPDRNWLIMVTVPVDDARQDLLALGVDNLLLQLWLLVAVVVLGSGAAFILLSQTLVFKPIKQIQEMKSDFVSLVSHQLKTPVAQVKGYVENMLDGLTGPINEKQRDYLNDMLQVATNNSRLIDDLLNISRIERGMLQVEKKPLETKEVLETILKIVRNSAIARGVKLVENIPSTLGKITGDPVKTKEAIRNIIDNAIKFTEPGKAVTISVVEETTSVNVTIKDEGQGIDPDVQKELFEKNRVWFGKVKASGAGLGLFLAKNFIEKTDGIITFTTEAGKGTTFVIRFKKA